MRIRLNQRNAIPFEMLTHTLLIRMVQTESDAAFFLMGSK